MADLYGISTQVGRRALLRETPCSVVRQMIEGAGFGIGPDVQARFEVAADRPFGEAFRPEDEGELVRRVEEILLAPDPDVLTGGGQDEDEDEPNEDEEFELQDNIVFEPHLEASRGQETGGELENGRAVQPSMFRAMPGMDEHAGVIERAVVSLASSVLDRGAAGEFATKMKFKRQSVTTAGVIIDEVWSIQVTARPAK